VRAVVGLALLLTACSEVPPFYCDEDEQCEENGREGTCTVYSQCAFPDGECPDFELRYDDSAGELAGVCVGDERFDPDCQPDVIEAPDEPGCSIATQNCIEECETENCFDNCVEEDATPVVCTGCIDDAYLACANQMGCQFEWDTLSCCYDECGDPDSLACRNECAAEEGTYDGCLVFVDDACSESIDVCF
jgi:hypothetical protein